MKITNGVTAEMISATGKELTGDLLAKMALSTLSKEQLLNLLEVIESTFKVTNQTLLYTAVNGDKFPETVVYNDEEWSVTSANTLLDKFEVKRTHQCDVYIKFETEPTEHLLEAIKKWSSEVFKSWDKCRYSFSDFIKNFGLTGLDYDFNESAYRLEKVHPSLYIKVSVSYFKETFIKRNQFTIK